MDNDTAQGKAKNDKENDLPFKSSDLPADSEIESSTNEFEIKTSQTAKPLDSSLDENSQKEDSESSEQKQDKKKEKKKLDPKEEELKHLESPLSGTKEEKQPQDKAIHPLYQEKIQRPEVSNDEKDTQKKVEPSQQEPVEQAPSGVTPQAQKGSLDLAGAHDDKGNNLEGDKVEPKEQPAKKEGKDITPLLIILLIVLDLVFGAFIVYGYLQLDKEPSSSNATSSNTSSEETSETSDSKNTILAYTKKK